MTRTKLGLRQTQVLKLLKDFGPSTARELADEMGIDRHQVTNILRSLAERPRPVNPLPRLIYIHDWIDSVPGLRKYLYPVYAIGNFPDKSRPSGSVRLRNAKKAYEERMKVRSTHNFVFNLGGARGRSSTAQC
jgi:transcriptional regulator with XRE-family HTH domain